MQMIVTATESIFYNCERTCNDELLSPSARLDDGSLCWGLSDSLNGFRLLRRGRWRRAVTANLKFINTVLKLFISTIFKILHMCKIHSNIINCKMSCEYLVNLLHGVGTERLHFLHIGLGGHNLVQGTWNLQDKYHKAKVSGVNKKNVFYAQMHHRHA